MNFLIKQLRLLEDHFFELLIGCKFSRKMAQEDMYSSGEVSSLFATHYEPIRCRNLRELIREGYRINKDIECFVDIGAGEGKACFYAGYFRHFKKIIGVELSGKLHRESVSNSRRLDFELQLLNTDALYFKLPEMTCFVLLFNPFDERALVKFFNNNSSHFDKFSSLIAYANDCHRDHLIKLGFSIKFRNASSKSSLLAFHGTNNA